MTQLFPCVHPLLLLCAQVLVAEAAIEAINQESNYVFPTSLRHRVEYPTCIGNSICAFLQANDKGVSVVRYCQCSSPALQCPVRWDAFDGKSITQSQSDQYKYCEKSPDVPKCSHEDQVAYRSWQRYRNERKVESRDDIKCVCPDGHNYLDTKYDFRMEGEDAIVEIEYFCLPLPACNATQYCKDITAKPGEYIVNPKCLCPHGQACPTITDRGVKTTRLGELTIHNIKCQDPLRAGVPYNLYMNKKRMSKRLTNRSKPNNYWGPPVGIYANIPWN